MREIIRHLVDEARLVAFALDTRPVEIALAECEALLRGQCQQSVDIVATLAALTEIGGDGSDVGQLHRPFNEAV